MAEGQEFAKILRSLEQFIQTVKGQKIFGGDFETCKKSQKNFFPNVWLEIQILSRLYGSTVQNN